jgi:arylsulfatase A-like enzyme
MSAPRYNVAVLMLDDVNPDGWNKMARLIGRVIPDDGPGNWVDFPHFYVNYALCGPSRFSFFTGRYVRHLQVFSHFNAQGTTLDTDGPWNGHSTPDPASVAVGETNHGLHTLPVFLQSVGYTCAGFGKYMNEFPFMLGDTYTPHGYAWNDWVLDDHSRKYETSPPSASVHAAHTGPDYFNYVRMKNGVTSSHTTTDSWSTTGTNQSGRYINQFLGGAAPSPSSAYATDLYCKQILDYLAAAPSQPWFIYWAQRATHTPLLSLSDENVEYGVAQRHRGLNASVFTLPNGSTVPIGPQSSAFDPANFNEADISDKPSWFRATYGPGGVWTGAGGTISSTEATTLRKERAAAWRALQAVDEAVYDLVYYLTNVHTSAHPTTGVIEPTINHTVLIITNDNSFTRGENRATKKTTPYQPSVRSRLIVRHPDVHPNNGGPGQHTDNALVSMVDLAPMICAIAGARPTRAFDGMDVTRRLLDPTVNWRREVRGAFNATAGDLTDVPHHSWIITQEPYDSTAKAQFSQLYKYILIPAKQDIVDLNGAPAYNGPGNWTVPEAEAYDLTADPGEMTNFANDPTKAALVGELATRRQRLFSV